MVHGHDKGVVEHLKLAVPVIRSIMTLWFYVSGQVCYLRGGGIGGVEPLAGVPLTEPPLRSKHAADGSSFHFLCHFHVCLTPSRNVRVLC